MRPSKILLKIIILAIALCYLSGCAVNHGHFTVASNKVFRISDFELEKADRVKGVEGKSVQHFIFSIIPVGSQPTIEGAMDDAMQKGGGDVMTDLQMEQWFFMIPYIYGQAGWSVTGDVVKTRKN